MFQSIRKCRFSAVSRLLSVLVSLSFAFGLGPAQFAYAQSVPLLPEPGAMVLPTSSYQPTILSGLNIHPTDPLQFEFIIDQGDSAKPADELETESTKLVKYFLASLTTPEGDMWVNLSPYESNRIIPENFGKTEMGRDLLAQDYMLKQLTASMMHPKDELGERFWERVKDKAMALFGHTDIPMNTFNKIWIVPDQAVIYEHEKGAFIVESHLNVMLEEDYMALQENIDNEKFAMLQKKMNDTEIVSGITSDVVRDVLIPEIEKEVNEGEIFANLRQVYHSMLLASWYKKRLKESLLGKIYVDQNKVEGININDPEANQKIYDRYVEAFEKGVYDFIKEEYDPASQSIIPRKYFSGGVHLEDSAMTMDGENDEVRRRVVEAGVDRDFLRANFTLSQIGGGRISLSSLVGTAGTNIADNRLAEEIARQEESPDEAMTVAARGIDLQLSARFIIGLKASEPHNADAPGEVIREAVKLENVQHISDVSGDAQLQETLEQGNIVFAYHGSKNPLAQGTKLNDPRPQFRGREAPLIDQILEAGRQRVAEKTGALYPSRMESIYLTQSLSEARDNGEVYLIAIRLKEEGIVASAESSPVRWLDRSSEAYSTLVGDAVDLQLTPELAMPETEREKLAEEYWLAEGSPGDFKDELLVDPQQVDIVVVKRLDVSPEQTLFGAIDLELNEIDLSAFDEDEMMAGDARQNALDTLWRGYRQARDDWGRANGEQVTMAAAGTGEELQRAAAKASAARLRMESLRQSLIDTGVDENHPDFAALATNEIEEAFNKGDSFIRFAVNERAGVEGFANAPVRKVTGVLRYQGLNRAVDIRRADAANRETALEYVYNETVSRWGGNGRLPFASFVQQLNRLPQELGAEEGTELKMFLARFTEEGAWHLVGQFSDSNATRVVLADLRNMDRVKTGVVAGSEDYVLRINGEAQTVRVVNRENQEIVKLETDNAATGEVKPAFRLSDDQVAQLVSSLQGTEEMLQRQLSDNANDVRAERTRAQVERLRGILTAPSDSLIGVTEEIRMALTLGMDTWDAQRDVLIALKGLDSAEGRGELYDEAIRIVGAREAVEVRFRQQRDSSVTPITQAVVSAMYDEDQGLRLDYYAALGEIFNEAASVEANIQPYTLGSDESALLSTTLREVAASMGDEDQGRVLLDLREDLMARLAPDD